MMASKEKTPKEEDNPWDREDAYDLYEAPASGDDDSCASAIARFVSHPQYNIPAVSRGLHACVAELLSVCAIAEEPEVACCSHALADIRMTVEAQKPFWPCLR